MFDLSKTYLLDGAMGTMLQNRGLSGLGEPFNLSNPETVRSIHSEYIEAGADIIETNTFSANRISLGAHSLEEKAWELAFSGARIAREAADSAPRKVIVAGSAGPTTKALSIATDASRPWLRELSFDELASAYKEQFDALISGGVDFILLETCIDALNAKAAVYSYLELGAKIPLAISVSCSDRSGRTLSGQTLRAFYESIRHAGPAAFGLNCSTGAARMRPLIKEVALFAECATLCYPNAGMPNAMGGYDETPRKMAADISGILSDGSANIVGGCCGTTPTHISAIKAILPEESGRTVPIREAGLTVSGLEAVEVDSARYNFTNVGERTNVAGSRKFARLIAGGNIEEALGVAAAQIDGGARIIDINMDDAMLDAPAEMEKFVLSVQSAPEVARAALMIDSSDFNAVLAGLKASQGKCIVNSLSLKEGEEDFLAKAAQVRRLGAALVVMAFDEKGQATDFKRKIEIAERAYRLLTAGGFAPEDIIFDPGILSVATGDPADRRYAVDFIEAVRWIKANLPGMQTSGGVSNLSFAFRGNNPVREAMHSVFLYHAINAGLDMAIVNPGALKPFSEIEGSLREAVADVILDRREDATERLLSIASGMADTKDSPAADTAGKPRSIREILVKGLPEGLEAALDKEMSRLGDARKVIEGPLMDGMETVGKMFEEGKMFLPQVIKSAKVMKQSVSYLTPLLASGSEDDRSSRPLALIATVKGDIHDIGKNITATVLGCNGFEVADLGVDVDCRKIVDEAVSRGAAVVCASGLITPSLRKMEELAAEMASRGMDTPLLIGGATTSELHTAVKLAPVYPHTYHCSDASATSVTARRLISDRVETEKALQEKQAGIRRLHSAREDSETPEGLFGYLSPEGFAPVECIPSAGFAAGEIPLAEAAALVDWKLFLSIWKIKAADYGRAEVKEILTEAKERLRTLHCHIKGALDFTAVPGCKAPFLGVFAASVHPCGEECGCCGAEDYLGRTLRLVLAEAAAEWLERRIEIPGGFKMIRPAVGYPSCRDHSLKKSILELLPRSSELGISLSESFAMSPEGSVCGFFVIHKDARYL